MRNNEDWIKIKQKRKPEKNLERNLTRDNMKTSKKDFLEFKTEFLKWIDKFGLNDIHFNFIHDDIPNYAQMSGEHSQKAYVVYFSKDFMDLKTIPKGYVKYIAYHEACECLLYRIRTIAIDREFNEDDLDSEIHMVINRLEKLLLPNKGYFNIDVKPD